MYKLPLTIVLGLTMVTTVASLSDYSQATTTKGALDHTLEYVYHDAEKDDKIHDALIRLNLNAEQLSDFDLVKSLISSRGWDKSNEYQQYYLMLVPEGVTSGLMCSAVRVDYLIPIFTKDDLKPFRAFFQNYWSGIFKKCAAKELDRVEAVINRPEHLGNFLGLDRFVKAALGFSERVINYGEYYNRLRGLDLAKAEGLHVRAMMKLIKRPHSLHKRSKFIRMQIERLQEFIERGLNPLFYSDLRGSFSVINMAIYLQNPPVFTILQLILNEYHRISVAWRDPKKQQEILANIKRQIEVERRGEESIS